jgi:hypothetical protein
MRISCALVAASLLAALAACTGPAGSTASANPPATAVTRSAEPDGRFLTLVSPKWPHGDPFLGVEGTNFSALRSSIDTKTGEIVHQLYVEDSYFGAERNWEAARGPSGEALRFVHISKNQISCDSGCSYAEEFAASLPEALLRANPKGLAVGFSAHSGAQQTILIPGDLIQRQLATVDAARAGHPIAAVASSPTPNRPR